MNLVDNFIDFREQIEQHNFYHIVVFNWVLIKSLIGSNFFGITGAYDNFIVLVFVQ